MLNLSRKIFNSRLRYEQIYSTIQEKRLHLPQSVQEMISKYQDGKSWSKKAEFIPHRGISIWDNLSVFQKHFELYNQKFLP